MKAVITICSKSKDPQPGLLPAQERYVSSHVQAARKIAQKSGLPFYILSGKHGLIRSSTPIENYDYNLEAQTQELTCLVTEQLQEAGITKIDFYRIDDSNWSPYVRTLTEAAMRAPAAIKSVLLPAMA